MAKVYVLDGARMTSPEAFYDEVSRVLIPGHGWGRNLDAFDDILMGGFGTPVEGFTIKWRNSEASRSTLGPTLFNTLLEIIRDHGPGGKQAKDNVRLLLY